MSNSDDVDVKYGCFNAGLIRVFRTPEPGLTFPKQGQHLNDIVKGFKVMLDVIQFGLDHTKHYFDNI